MEAVIHLDTHVVAWLFQGDRQRLKPIAHRLERNHLVVSPMVALELQYLFEIGRLRVPASDVLGFLLDRYGLRESGRPFADVVRVAMGLTWTRDPFDRLIAAQAMVEEVPLLTFDESLRVHCPVAVWG